MTWDEMVAWYSGLSENDPARHEFDAFVYMRLSYACQRKADLLRTPRRPTRRSEPLSGPTATTGPSHS